MASVDAEGSSAAEPGSSAGAAAAEAPRSAGAGAEAAAHAGASAQEVGIHEGSSKYAAKSLQADSETALVQPPEGFEWASRWAELENATAALEADRDALKVEVAQLRRQHVDQAMTALSESTKAAAVDSKEFKQIQAQLDEERHKAEKYLGELVNERNTTTKLSEDLQQRTAELASLSTQKLQLHHEKTGALSELLPVKEERDRILREKEASERRAKELQEELAGAFGERDALFREKADLRHELLERLDGAWAEAKAQGQAAEEARAVQAAAERRAEAAEQRLKERTQDLRMDISALESKLTLRGEQLGRMTELRKVAQQQLDDAIRDRDAAVAAHAGASREAEELRARTAQLEEQLGQLKGEQEKLIRQRVPGTDGDVLPDGFQSLSELFREATSAREEALNQRQLKEQLQSVLQEVESEVRVRYPVLLRQREEAERLRHVADALTQQNESLLAQVQEMDAAKQEAEAAAGRARRSEQVLEAHARDVAQQLAVLLHENRRLAAGAAGAAGTVGAGPEAPEGAAPEGAFRTVQELARQNEALRRSVARLAEERRAAVRAELVAVREERDQQFEEWKAHLAEKAEQMKALVDTVERVTRERDEAQRALKERIEATPVPGPDEPEVSPSRDAQLREHLHSVREEFARCTGILHKDALVSRTSELKVQQELATVKGQLDFETSRNADLATSLQKAERRLEERSEQIRALEDKFTVLEESRRTEESNVRELEASLGQARRDLNNLGTQLKLERVKVTDLERSNTTLLAEKVAHGQLLIDLQARMAQESDSYKEMKRDLEESYRKEVGLLKEQLELSRQRQEELGRGSAELAEASAAREVEAAEARARAAELQAANARLEEQLVLRAEEIHQLHAAGNARPRRGGEVTAEAQAQLELSQSMRQRLSDAKKVEEKLHLAEEREQEHIKSGQFWQSLVKTQEAELKAKQDEVAGLQKTLETLRGQQAVLQEEGQKAQQREEQLEGRLQELGREAAELRASLGKKDAEVSAARLEGEQKATEAASRLETAERESAGSKDVVEEWQQRHREAVTAHSKDIQVFNDVKARYAALERETKGLRQRCGDLAADAERARSERANELESLRQRLGHAERHASALAAETRGYQDRLLALSESGRPEDAAEAAGVAAEKRCARELGELQRQELEVDKARVEREAGVLRAEVADLQKRLDAAEREALQMESKLRHGDRAAMQLGQLHLLEDENRRLSAEIKSLEGQREDLRKEVEAKKLEAAPLQRSVNELRRKDEASEKLKKELEAKCQEWKSLYDEVIQKFDAHHIQEFKRLTEAESGLLQERNDVKAQLSEVQQELKRKEEELKQELKRKADELKQQRKVDELKQQHQNSELQKHLEQEKQKAAQLTQQKQQLEEDIKKKDQQSNHLQSLKTIRDRRIMQMEQDYKKLEEAHKKLDESHKKLEESQKRHEESQKRLEEERQRQDKRLEEERRKSEEAARTSTQVTALRKAEEVAQRRADRAMALAMDCQRALEAREREARSREAPSRSNAGASVGAPGAAAPSAAAAAPAPAPAPAAAVRPREEGAEAGAGAKRKASADDLAGSVRSSAPAASATSGSVETGGPAAERNTKVARTSVSDTGGSADAACGASPGVAVEAKAVTPKAKKAPAAAKARALQAATATGVATSVTVGNVSAADAGRASAASTSSTPPPTSAPGSETVVDLEVVESRPS